MTCMSKLPVLPEPWFDHDRWVAWREAVLDLDTKTSSSDFEAIWWLLASEFVQATEQATGSASLGEVVDRFAQLRFFVESWVWVSEGQRWPGFCALRLVLNLLQAEAGARYNWAYRRLRGKPLDSAEYWLEYADENDRTCRVDSWPDDPETAAKIAAYEALYSGCEDILVFERKGMDHAGVAKRKTDFCPRLPARDRCRVCVRHAQRRGGSIQTRA